MAWTTPRTWTTGEIVTAATMNTDHRDNISFLINAPACRVFNSGTISVPNGADTLLTFDSESSDNDTMHSTTTNPGRITFNTAGFYVLGAVVNWASNATGQRVVYARLNGVTRIGQVQGPPVNGADTMQVLTLGYKVAASDYVEFFGFQNTGGSLNIGTGNGSPAAWAARVSAG